MESEGKRCEQADARHPTHRHKHYKGTYTGIEGHSSTLKRF